MTDPKSFEEAISAAAEEYQSQCGAGEGDFTPVFLAGVYECATQDNKREWNDNGYKYRDFEAGFTACLKSQLVRDMAAVITDTTSYLNGPIALLPCESRQRDLSEDGWGHLMYLRDALDIALEAYKKEVAGE